MQYGITLGSNENYYAAGQIAADDGAEIFSFLKSAGVPIIRIDCSYRTTVPPYNSSSNLACGQDPNIKAILAAGCQPLLMLDAYPAAASESAFLTFVTNVVTYYAGLGVTLWEILNEPSAAKNWQSTPTYEVSAAGYAGLIESVYGIIKSIQPGSESTVLAGALAALNTTADSAGSNLELSGYGEVPTVWTLGNDSTDVTVDAVDFLKGMFAAGTTGGAWAGAPPMDALSMHPYTNPGLPHSGAGYYGELATNQAIMTALGYDIPIWISEFGFENPTPASDPSGTCNPDYAAQGLSQAFSIISAQNWTWLQGFIVFDIFDDATDGNYGYFDQNRNAKPIWGHYMAQIHNLPTRYLTSGGSRKRIIAPQLPEL